jgi:hypothetical protein
MTMLRWVAQLFWRNPTPFTFLIFVVIVLFYVLKVPGISERNQAVVVWGLVLLLVPATILVVLSLLPGSLTLTARERQIVNKHIALETGKVSPCPNRHIGKPIGVAQKRLLALYNKILIAGT